LCTAAQNISKQEVFCNEICLQLGKIRVTVGCMVSTITSGASIAAGTTIPPAQDEDSFKLPIKRHLDSYYKALYRQSSLDLCNNEEDRKKMTHLLEAGKEPLEDYKWSGLLKFPNVRNARLKDHRNAQKILKTLPPHQCNLIFEAMKATEDLYKLEKESKTVAADAAVTCVRESLQQKPNDIHSIIRSATVKDKSEKIARPPGKFSKTFAWWGLMLNGGLLRLNLWVEWLTGFSPLIKFREFVRFLKLLNPSSHEHQADANANKGIAAINSVKHEKNRLATHLRENCLVHMNAEARELYIQMLDLSGMSDFSVQAFNLEYATYYDAEFNSYFEKMQPHGIGYEVTQLWNRYVAAKSSLLEKLTTEESGHRSAYVSYDIIGAFRIPAIADAVQSIYKEISIFAGNDPKASNLVNKLQRYMVGLKTNSGANASTVDLYSILIKVAFSGVALNTNYVPEQAVDYQQARKNAVLNGGDEGFVPLVRLADTFMLDKEQDEASRALKTHRVIMWRPLRVLLNYIQKFVPFLRFGASLEQHRYTEEAVLTTLYSELLRLNQLEPIALSPTNKNPEITEDYGNLLLNINRMLVGLSVSAYANCTDIPLMETIVERFNNKEIGLKLTNPAHFTDLLEQLAQQHMRRGREVGRLYNSLQTFPVLNVASINPLTDPVLKPQIQPVLAKESRTFTEIKKDLEKAAITGKDFETYMLEPDTLVLHQLAVACKKDPTLKANSLEELRNLLFGKNKNGSASSEDSPYAKIFHSQRCGFLQEPDLKVKNPSLAATGHNFTTQDGAMCCYRKITLPLIEKLQSYLKDICTEGVINENTIVPWFDKNNSPDPSLYKNMSSTGSAFGRLHGKEKVEQFSSYNGWMRAFFAEGGTGGVYWRTNSDENGNNESAIRYISGRHFDEAMKYFIEEKEKDLGYTIDHRPSAEQQGEIQAKVYKLLMADPCIGTHHLGTAQGIENTMRSLQKFNGAELADRYNLGKVTDAVGALAVRTEQSYPELQAIAKGLALRRKILKGNNLLPPPDRLTYQEQWGPIFGMFGWALDKILYIVFKAGLYTRMPRASSNREQAIISVLPSGLEAGTSLTTPPLASLMNIQRPDKAPLFIEEAYRKPDEQRFKIFNNQDKEQRGGGQYKAYIEANQESWAPGQNKTSELVNARNYYSR
jgi:hypothetical protein